MISESASIVQVLYTVLQTGIADNPPDISLFLNPILQLREIEIIVAARLEEPEDGVEEGEILKRIQDILYQTEVSRSRLSPFKLCLAMADLKDVSLL